MDRGGGTLHSRVEALYRRSTSDPDMSDILLSIPPHDDAELAELIEVDGRTRLSLRREVELRRYVRAVPDLQNCELALDAAIDVTLRHLSSGTRPTAEAVSALMEAYPNLRAAIEDAATLATEVLSTTGVSDLVRSAPEREVPSDFGPAIGSGKRRFELTRLLGSGSAGEVYLAIDRQLSERDRPALVAIKLLAGMERSSKARRQLIEEATKARRVLHDHVVRVLDRGVSDDNEDYIVYEYVEGGDLEQWYVRADRKVDPVDAAWLMVRVARGLHAAHTAGLVHCDLKPSNILMTDRGEPKVADFGIAVRESEQSAKKLEEGKPIGNIAFISPEQYRGEDGSLSALSDVYAVGGILYYLLTGHLPNGSTVEAIAQNHARDGRVDPPSPRLLNGRIDADLDAICRRAMATVPAQRHASAAALADDLESWIHHEPIAWTRPSLWKVARMAARRRPTVAAAICLAAFSILAGSAAGGYWASVATKSKKEAFAAGRKVDSTKENITNMLVALRRMKKDKVDRDFLAMLVALEALGNMPILNNQSAEPRRAVQDKMETLRRMLRDNAGVGRGAGVETLIWEGVLGYWEMNEGMYDEAERRFAENADHWKAQRLENDILARQYRVLGASAGVFRLARIVESRELNSTERDLLGGLESGLAPEVFDGPFDAPLMRTHQLNARIALYGPKMLNKPDRVKEAKRLLPPS